MTYEEFKKSALNKKNETNTNTNISEGYLKFKNKALGINESGEKQPLPFTNSNGKLNPFALTQHMATTTDLITKETQADALIGQENRKKMQNKIANNQFALRWGYKRDDIEAYKILTGKSEEEVKQEIVYAIQNNTPDYQLSVREGQLEQKYDAITPVANYVAGDLATDVNEAYAEYSNNPTEENKKKVEYAEKLYNDYVTNAKNVGKGGWITKDFANYLPQSVEQFDAGLKGGLIGGVTTSAVGSVVPAVGNVIGFAGGFKGGYVGGVAKYSYDQMQGAMYKALIDLGREYNVEITHDMALEISKDTAFLQALVEGAETAIDLTSMGISKLFKKGGTETVKAMTRKQIIAKALKAYGINLVTETLEEGSQEKIAIEGEKKALSQVGINNPYTKEQETERIKEAGYGGFKIATIAGLGNLGGTVVVSAINNKNIGEINRAYDTAISEINANEKLSTEEKQAQIATLTNERIQVLQKVKGEIDKNAENRTQISEKNAGNNMETAKNITETTEKPITSQETPNNKMEIAVNRSLANTKSRGKTLLGKINDMAKNKIQELLNIDVTGRRHIIADNDIRHMINEHGNAELEAKKGQIAITVDDIKKIPEIIENPDDIIKGTENKEGKAVRYIKQFENDNTFVVEVIPNEGKNLIIKTMWKKPVALANDSTSLASTSETQGNVVDSTSSKNIITPSESYVNKKEKAPITKAKETTKTITRTKQEQPIEKIDDFGEKIGGARKDLWVGTKKHATREVIHNYSIARDVEVGEDGKEKTIYSVKFKGHLLKGNIASEEEAQKFIEDFKNTIKNNSAKVKEVRYRGKDKEEKTGYTVEITDPRTLKTRDTYKIFDNKEEAESYAMALSMYISEHGKNLFRPQIQRITRENPDMDNTLKATGQEILDTFKFRGGEFGNWVNNAERQKFLNYGYDALMDLATALDIKPEDLSYGGKMAIAFGARGKGLTSAVAHFEPVAKVINMTRLKGAGSLAHEMGHGLDNFLSQIAGYDENGLISENERYARLPENVSTAIKELIKNIRYSVSTDQAEIDKKNAIFEKNRISSLNTHLSWYDRVFNGETTRYKKVKGEYQRVPIVPTSEQKKEYERIKKILIAGKLETKRDPNWVTNTKLDWIYAEPLETLKTMIKAITNRKADEDTIYWLYRYGIPSQQVKEVKSESAFVKASRELDAFLGRATPYYNTIAEQIARSFEAFVFDELKKKNITNTYLVHSVYNENYALFNPFPAGEERKNINKAWKNLIEVMKEEGIFTSSSDDGARYDLMPMTIADKLIKLKDSFTLFKEGLWDSELQEIKNGKTSKAKNIGTVESKGKEYDIEAMVFNNYGRYETVIKAYDEGKQVGVLIFYRKGRDLVIRDLGMSREGTGLGTTLAEMLIAEAKAQPQTYEKIIASNTTNTFNGKPSATYWEKLGFKEQHSDHVLLLNPTNSDDIRYDLMPTMKNGFYSQLENVIINKMQKQAKTSDIMNLIQKNGVKQDEIAWTGVDDFLASRDTVTKEELLQYIRASQLEVEEVIYEDNKEQIQEELENRIRDYEYEVEQLETQMRDILEQYNIPYEVLQHIYEDEYEMYDRTVDFVEFTEDGDVVIGEGEDDIVSEYAFRQDLREYVRLQDEREDLQHEIDAYYSGDEDYFDMSDYNSTKFQQYATDWRGGTNYREILYKAPHSTYTKALSTYKSPHWNENNVIAHTRLQDYEDDGGAKVLFIEEIQSDLHQEGRRYGYKSKIEDYDKKINDLKDELQYLMDSLALEKRKKRTRLNNRYVEMRDELKQIQARHFIDDKSLTIELIRPLEKKTDPESHVVGYTRNTVIDTKYLNDADTQLARESMGFSQEELERIVFLHNKILETLQEEKEISLEIVEIQNNNEEVQKLSAEIEGLELEKRNNYKKIDSKFPFKTKWHEFVIRKAINEAVQNGYDKVAWTTGEQQAERYDLRKHIDEIKYRLHDDGTFTVHVYKNGYSIESFENQTADDLENLLGKSIAEKMINNEGEVEFTKSLFSDASREWYSLSGLDLQVGGEGMKGFYDKIVPDYVNKYIKKWNSKVEEVRIPDYGGEVHVQQGFTITPEMRKSVQEIGQPLYDKEPSIDTMSRKNIIEKIRGAIGIEYFANTNKELNSIASEIREKIKGRKITTTDIKNIADEIGQKLITRVGGKKASIKDFFIDTYGKDGWNTIAQSIADEIKAIRDEYDLENPIDTSKRARVADKRTRDILHALNISDEEIYDPANAFVQNILESMEKDTEYFSRTLKEIEEENLMFGNKRVNTILNKRRYDVQSGRVKANPKYTEGASLSSIRKTIEAHTGKKIGLNGFRQRAYGIYKPTLDTIRIKNISNVETAIHELGHRINYVELNQSLKGASRAELNKLAERAFGPMYDDKPDVKLEEGWAEFTKRFICDNEATVKEYPQLSTYMVEQLEGNKNMKAVVEKLIELSEQYVNAPTAKQIRKMQSVGQDTDSSDKRTFFGQYMYEVHDDLYDIKRMMKTFAKAMKVKYWDITPELNIYNLMRLARSNEDRILNVMQYGLIDDRGNRRTEGLGELSELLGNDPEQIQKVRDLLIAMRTLDYTAVGLDTGLSTAEAMKLIKEYSQDKTIMRVANGIITFQDEVMKYAVEKGLMTQEQYEEMKKWNRFYIPLKRVFEGKVNSSSGGTGASKLTKRRTGSMRDIIDPFEAIIQNTSMILDKINQNEIMRTLALLQEKTGIADFYEKIAPPQKLQAEVELNLFKNFLEEQGVDTDEIDLDVVQKIFAPMMNDESKMIMGYMEKGKLQAIEFKDRFIYEAISQSAGNADLGVILERALSVSQLLRLGATSGNIEFAIPNMISDTMTAWMFSESGFVPLVDTFRGLVDYSLANYGWADNLTKDSKYKQQNKFLYDLYKQSGATMATRVGSYRPEVQEYVLEIFGKHANDLLSDDVNVQKEAGKEIMKKLSRLLGKTQDVLSILPELSEQATRFEHFKKDYLYARNQGHNHKNALLKATINTRDITMDFNRMGHTMRVYNRIRAFSGARAQGIYRFIEAVNKMPKKVLGKLGILAGLAIALKAGAEASGNKKEEEITDQVRKDNFIIPLGKDGEVVTIKKPQGTARSIINFAELLYDVGFGNVDEKDYNKTWLNWLKDTIEENAPLELDLREGNDFFSTVANMALPTALEPIIENALNKDFYYGNPIIPYGKEGLRTEDQYDENTSQTAILLGKVLGQSPAKIENLITGWTAGVGQQTLDLSDAILGKLSKDIPDQPSRELNSKTVLRRFFANSFKNSDSVSEVYEQIEKIEQLKEYEEASETELETLEKLNSAKKTMSDLNKQIKGVRNSLTLTSDQKRDQIKDLQILRTDVARNALGKELINPESKEQVELYEYYPSKTTFKYEVHANKTVEVEYTEDDMREYARIVKDTYETALAKEQKKRTYKEMTPEEQKKKRNSLLTSAKSSAQEKVSREIYRRSR